MFFLFSNTPIVFKTRYTNSLLSISICFYMLISSSLLNDNDRPAKNTNEIFIEKESFQPNLLWKESTIEIKAESMDEFKELLQEKDDYTTWIEKSIIVMPLELDEANENAGYFGLLFDSPIFNTNAICWSELKMVNQRQMKLFLKKVKPKGNMLKKWESIIKSKGKDAGFEINEFEAVWTFTELSKNRFLVKLKVGVEPPLNKLVNIFMKRRFRKFVSKVAKGTLKKVKEKIENGK